MGTSCFIGSFVGCLAGVLIGNWIWNKLFHVEQVVPHYEFKPGKIEKNQSTSGYVLYDWERRKKE